MVTTYKQHHVNTGAETRERQRLTGSCKDMLDQNNTLRIKKTSISSIRLYMFVSKSCDLALTLEDTHCSPSPGQNTWRPLLVFQAEGRKTHSMRHTETLKDRFTVLKQYLRDCVYILNVIGHCKCSLLPSLHRRGITKRKYCCKQTTGRDVFL